MKTNRLLFGLGAVAAVAVIAIALILMSGNDDATTGTGPIIAEANGHSIYQSDADARIAGVSDVHGDIETTLGPDWRSFILKTLVDDVIVREEAQHLGITITDDEMKSKVDDVKRQVGTAKDFEAWLEENDMDEAELERRLDLQLLASEVYIAVTADALPTEDDVRQYYDDDLSQFTVDGEPRPFIEVRVSIEDTLTTQWEQAAYTKWLENKRAAAVVVVLDDDWK